MSPILDFWEAIAAVSLLLTIWSLYLTRRQIFPVEKAEKRSRLAHPPGWRLRRLAELCFSKKVWNDVFEPTLSDMQREHLEALAAGRPWKVRMVLVRGYGSFWLAIVAQLPISFARRVFEVWKATKTGS